MSPTAPDILLRFVPDRGKLAVMCAGYVVFTAAAAFMLLAAEPEELGLLRPALWIALVLCPVLAVDALARLIRRTPNLVATSQGLLLRSILGFSPTIPWAEIAGFAPVVMGKKPYLAILLADPVASFARLGLPTRLMHAKSHAAGVPNITFRAIELGTSPAQAAEQLEQIRHRMQGLSPQAGTRRGTRRAR